MVVIAAPVWVVAPVDAAGLLDVVELLVAGVLGVVALGVVALGVAALAMLVVWLELPDPP